MGKPLSQPDPVALQTTIKASGNVRGLFRCSTCYGRFKARLVTRAETVLPCCGTFRIGRQMDSVPPNPNRTIGSMTPPRRWLFSLTAVILTATISYWWLDRSIARLASARLSHHETFARVSQMPDPFLPLAAVVLIGLALWSISGRLLSRAQTVAVVSSLSVLIAEAIKNQLKFVFGRTWPEAWFPDGPSFIRDGAYGFNPFHGGVGYGSFPSGHMAVACAILSVFWIYYPKLRAVCFVAALGVAGGLVGGNYHFLSDVIVGAFIGASTGWMATGLWRVRPAGAA